jgi:hypothetical protein
VETHFEPRQAARFLRLLRVATGVAIAADDLRKGARAAPATFLALAAKTGAWRFPEEGLVSGDGLLSLKLTPGALLLQAQGAAGLSVYAGRTAQVRIGERWSGECVFDRFGAARAAFAEGDFDEADLAGVEVELIP